MKTVLFSLQARAFADSMSAVSRIKLDFVVEQLEANGFCSGKFTRKISGHDNLFEIRILTKNNERFFYAYAQGDDIWILRGFEKKTQATPAREIAEALRARKYYIGE